MGDASLYIGDDVGIQIFTKEGKFKQQLVGKLLPGKKLDNLMWFLIYVW